MKRWILVAAALVGAGCKSGPSEDQCKQLLEHLVDLEFKKAGVAATTDVLKAEMAKQKQAVYDTKTAEFMTTCTASTNAARVECSLTATDLDAVAKCDEAAK